MAEKPKIIGISGGSGSGKTTLALALYNRLGHDNAVLISEDDYYKNTATMPGFGDPDFNYDDPIIRDHELLLAHLNDFTNGISFQKPLYDFANHCRHQRTEEVMPCKYWILEGTHTLVNPKIRSILDYKIYVDSDESVRFKRRLARDINERGRTKESVIEQFNKNVKPSHIKWTEPTRDFADLIVENNNNTENRQNQFTHEIRLILSAIEN